MHQKVLMEADIICCTLTSSGCHRLRECFQSKPQHFTAVIVDEAAQCSELLTLIPLLYHSTKLVLVGDPAQLPSTVKSLVCLFIHSYVKYNYCILLQRCSLLFVSLFFLDHTILYLRHFCLLYHSIYSIFFVFFRKQKTLVMGRAYLRDSFIIFLVQIIWNIILIRLWCCKYNTEWILKYASFHQRIFIMASYLLIGKVLHRILHYYSYTFYWTMYKQINFCA